MKGTKWARVGGSAAFVLSCAVSCTPAKPDVVDTAEDLKLAPVAQTAPILNDRPIPPQQAPVPAQVSRAPAPRSARPPATPAPPETAAATPRPAAATVSVPAATQPEPPAPQKAPAPQIAEGTQLQLRLAARTCDNTLRSGDILVTTLDQDVSDSSGARLAAGSSVTLAVSKLADSTDTSGTATIGLQPRSVQWDDQTIPLVGNVVSVPTNHVKRPISKATIAKGAVAGALLGLLSGKGVKGVAAGAAAGGAVGTGVAIVRRDFDVCMPSGGIILVRLTSPVMKK